MYVLITIYLFGFSVYVQNIYQENDELIVMYCVHHRAQHTYGCKFCFIYTIDQGSQPFQHESHKA